MPNWLGVEWVWGLLQPGFAPPPASHDHFNHWLQLRFDFDSTAIRLLIKGH